MPSGTYPRADGNRKPDIDAENVSQAAEPRRWPRANSRMTARARGMAKTLAGVCRSAQVPTAGQPVTRRSLEAPRARLAVLQCAHAAQTVWVADALAATAGKPAKGRSPSRTPGQRPYGAGGKVSGCCQVSLWGAALGGLPWGRAWGNSRGSLQTPHLLGRLCMHASS